MKFILLIYLAVLISGCVHKPYIPSGQYKSSGNDIAIIFTNHACTIVLTEYGDKNSFRCNIRRVSLGSDDFYIIKNGASVLSGSIFYDPYKKEVFLNMKGKETRLKVIDIKM